MALAEGRASATRDAESPGPAVPAVVKGVLGGVAVLFWGLFFDQLTRVGGWVLDTYNVRLIPPLLDLHARYRDAFYIWHHHRLYGYRHGAYTYPPLTAYLFLPFHLIGWHATEIVWTVGNVVLLAILFTITLRRFFGIDRATAWLVSAAGLAPAAIFLLFPFRSLLYWGQLSLILVLMVFVDLFVVPARFRGVLIGAATAIKLLPALFVVWLLARKEVSAVLRVGAAFVVLTLAAAALWPHASDLYWLHILPSGRDVMMVADPTNLPTAHGMWYFGVGKVDNQSLRGLLGRPPFVWTGTFPWIALALAVLALGCLVAVWILRQWRDRDLLAFVVLTLTTVLVSPVSWVHYWVFAGLAPFVAMLEWRRDRVLAIASILLTVAMCANLEDPRLDGLYFVGGQFSTVAPVVLFVVRNLYVLGGLAFLGLVAWRVAPSRHPADKEAGDKAADKDAAPELVSPATP